VNKPSPFVFQRIAIEGETFSVVFNFSNLRAAIFRDGDGDGGQRRASGLLHCDCGHAGHDGSIWWAYIAQNLWRNCVRRLIGALGDLDRSTPPKGVVTCTKEDNEVEPCVDSSMSNVRRL
jgi:hypothetical protein